MTITAANHFNGAVSLTDTLPSGLVCGTINPTTVTGSGTATVSCNATVAGNYTLTITGTNGTLSHSATILFSAQDYTITANFVSVQINAGSSGSSILTITPLNHFSGTVSLSASGTAGLNPAVNPTNLPGGSGTATLAFSSSTAGNYTATINSSSGTLTHAITVTVQVVDFAIGASPTAITILAGASGNSTATVTVLNGFSGTVNLTLATSMGLTATITPTNIARAGSSTLTVSASASGDYSVAIRAASGSLSHTIGVIIHVLDYSLIGNPVSIVTPIGSSTSSTLTLQSLNGYSGNVSLTYTVQAASTGSSAGGLGGGSHPLIMAPPEVLPAVSVSPQSFQFSPGGTQRSTVSISLPSNLSAGNYLITVMTSDGKLSHQIVLTIAATDFSITATPNSTTLKPGSNTTIVVNLRSLNFFQGNVTLAVTSPAGGPIGTLSTPTIQLTFYSNVNLNLTIQVPSNTALGNYTITIQATSGTVSHALSVPVSVTATGFATILAEVFSIQNSISISATIILALLATFGALKIKTYRRGNSGLHRRCGIENHTFQRSATSRFLSYPSGLPLLWGARSRDDL
jgi:hypothetical protein